MNDRRKISVFGSSGVIGKQTLDIIRAYPEDFELVALTGWKSLDILVRQCLEFCPKFVACSYDIADQLRDSISSSIQVLEGKEGLKSIAQLDVDIVVGGVVGVIGLPILYETLFHTKTLCIANKESIICGGTWFLDQARQAGTQLIPIDSEHSALYQLLEYPEFVSSLVLIASGGPFYNSHKNWDEITPKDVLRHPVWDLGFKVATDSALLTNKALELVEAHYLFRIPCDNIHIYVHPQGAIHGAINYRDGVTLWQTSKPDMKIPIAYALYWPERPNLITSYTHNPALIQPLDITCIKNWTIDPVKHPFAYSIDLMRQALKLGHGQVMIYNMADEVAVDKFKQGTLGFHQIVPFIERALDRIQPSGNFDSLNTIVDFCDSIYHQLQKGLQ